MLAHERDVAGCDQAVVHSAQLSRCQRHWAIYTERQRIRFGDRQNGIDTYRVAGRVRGPAMIACEEGGGGAQAVAKGAFVAVDFRQNFLKDGAVKRVRPLVKDRFL